MNTLLISGLRPSSRTRAAGIIAALLGLAVLLTGCAAGGYSDSYAEPAVAGGAGAPQVGGDNLAHDGEWTEGGTYDTSRDLIVTGSVYMTVENPIDTADAVARIVQTAGGRIDARSERAPDEWHGGSAELTMRIPVDKLDAVVEQLRDFGTIDEYSSSGIDVTNEVQDLEARISTLRASTLRIEGLLADAKDITDIITLENELASRQAELESLEARQRGLDDQVSLSTIYLSLTTEPVVFVDDSPSTFLDGLESGWNALVDFFAAALVVLGVLLPWLAVLALITAAIVIPVKARKKARVKAAADIPPPPPLPVEQPEPAPASAVKTKTKK